MLGRFVTFEGLDGSGKSTHLRRALEWLRRHGLPCIATHEPGGTPLGDALREVFLDPRWGTMDGIVELLLVFASRRQHLLEVIEPALKAGKHVLSDRFSDSSFAYQGSGRGIPLELVSEADAIATGSRRPDLTLLFDLPAEVARSRGRSPRRRARSGGIDRLDGEDLDFYRRVRDGFLARAAGERQRFVIIDSSGDHERTAEQVRRALQGLLQEP